MVAEEEWDFYERPPLSKASLLEPDAALPRLFTDEVQQALNLTGTDRCALNLSIAMKKVLLSNGEQLSYNILLIATGGRARLPSQAWASHPQVYTLRHWQDAQRLKSRLMESHKLAIIGGGWIGLEIAASARKSCVAVTLFEQQPALCMRSVSGEVSQRLEAIHREQGVEIRTGCGALELEDDGGLPVVHCDGNRETFDAVVVGIGVDLNLELARDAGLKTGRGSWWMPVDAPRSVHLCRRRCRPAPSLRLVHPVLGPSPRIRRWQRRKRCSIPMRQVMTTRRGCGRINTSTTFRSSAFRRQAAER